MEVPASRMPVELQAEWRRLGMRPELALGEALAKRAAERGHVPLLFHSADSVEQASLAEVHQRGRDLASSLHALGLGKGDVIAMQVPSSIVNAVICQAVAALGAVLLPIVHIYGPHELAHILADSGATALIVPRRWRAIDYAERLARLPDLPKLEHRIVLGDDAPAGMIASTALPRGTVPEVSVDPDAAALMLYTSGTTAAPKGARHSSRSLQAELVAQGMGRSLDDWALSPWPSGHIAGTLGVMGHALIGRPTILLESWDPALAAELVERHRVSQMSGTPFHLAGLIDAAERDGRDLTSFKEFLLGAATVPPALVARSEAMGVRSVRCYGSTEMPTATQCLPGDPLEKRLNTDGRPNPGVEVRIVGDAGQNLPAGSEGEIAVRGAERFIGYTDPALNAESFLPGGWFLTGDIGRLDGDGFLAITDRKKDIIIRGGENISSREVEELLLDMPGIAEAAAIGIPDERLGEKVCAVIRVVGQAPDIAAIDAHFSARGVARQKTPEALVVVDDFPRTPSGKVQKAELRKALAGQVS